MLQSRITLVLGSLALAGAATAAVTAFQPSSPFTQEGMPMMEQSKEHKKVQAGVGEWEGTLSMPNPMGEGEMEMPCTERVEAIGDLWTISLFEMEMMPGMSFQGSSTFGYDPEKKKYVGTWIDAFTTQIISMEGEELEDGRIAMTYEQMNPEVGKVTKRRNVMKHEGDSMHVEFFETVDGEEKLSMTIKMKRKK